MHFEIRDYVTQKLRIFSFSLGRERDTSLMAETEGRENEPDFLYTVLKPEKKHD